MTEAARLVDELTTLLYEVVKRWQLQDGRVCEIVVCGACRKKADRAESVVHDSDCPVYRLIRAEAANTAVVRANAEEIADLEDKRDDLEAQVNTLTAQMECRNELTARIRALEVENERGQQAFADLTLASVERINALEAERDALRARAERAEAALAPCTLALEYRDGVTCREERDKGVCLNHRVIQGLRVHAVTADRLELENRALRRQVRASYGIIHDGLHGGKPTDPEHQEACEMPSCRNARAVLAGSREQERE